MTSIKSLKAVLIVTSLLGSIVACSPKAAQNSVDVGTNENTSIIGGVQVDAQDTIGKTTVAIIASVVTAKDEEGQFVCTGSLLRDNIVLTAAHCVPAVGLEYKEVTLFVVFARDINKATQADVRLVVDSVIHADYGKANEQGQDNHDVALIRFAGPMPAGYELAKILEDETLLTEGKKVILAGYGLNKTDGVKTESDNSLRKTEVSIYADFGKHEIVLDQTQGKGACHGDSGGPAFLVVDGAAFVWGVTSRGLGQNGVDDCSLVSIYTKVNSEIAFVSSALAELEAKK